eukprot:8426458-Pyramimonas_sp.AAC.1
MGMTDKDLKDLNAVAAFALFGKAKGRSRAVQYPLADPPGLDPSYIVNTLPLITWWHALHQ